MKPIDYLRVAAIEEKVKKNACLTSEEIVKLQVDSAQKAIARLKELSLALPFPPDHPNVILLQQSSPACRAYRLAKTNKQGFSKQVVYLTVVSSFSIQKDDKLWQHVSVSGEKMPSYGDLCLVNSMFIGPDKTAIQVFPDASKHVNDHLTCLHLWSCLESELLPDFTWFGTV